MFDLVAQLASILGGPNGQQVAAQLDQAGIPPPSKLGGPLPVNPTQGYSEMDTQTPAAAPVPAAPAASPAAPAGPDLLKLAMAANQGVKAPEPIKPIMSGGVTGGVRAPEMTGKVGASAPAVTALLQSMMGGGPAAADPLRVPTLGSLVRR